MHAIYPLKPIATFFPRTWNLQREAPTETAIEVRLKTLLPFTATLIWVGCPWVIWYYREERYP